MVGPDDIDEESVMNYIDQMSRTIARETRGSPSAVGFSAYYAGLTLMQYEPALAHRVRGIMEALVAKQEGISPEQVEVKVRQAHREMFDG